MWQWFALFRSDPKAAKKMLMKAMHDTEVNCLEHDEREANREATTYCLECGVEAASKQALAMHMYRTHHTKRGIRSCVETTTCLACGLMAASRQRLVDHLSEKSDVCAYNYYRRYLPLNADDVKTLDEGARNGDPSRRLRLDGAHGVRMHGPYLPVYSTGGIRISSRHPLGPSKRWQG